MKIKSFFFFLQFVIAKQLRIINMCKEREKKLIRNHNLIQIFGTLFVRGGLLFANTENVTHSNQRYMSSSKSVFTFTKSSRYSYMRSAIRGRIDRGL